jgi:exosortase/archaeosortase family protein
MGKSKKISAASAVRKSGRIGVARFAFTYIVLMGAFFVLIGFKPLQDIIDLNGLYTDSVVLITSKVLSLSGVQCSREGSLIHLPAISLNVKFGCNGLEAVMIYAVAVIAYPASWKMRSIGILAGFLVIQIINIIRIAGLAYAAVYFKEIFEYMHIYVAQGIMIAVSLAVFFMYLHYAERKRAAD